jgi:hypothetical protein
MKTLEKFLLEYGACDPGFEFAKDLTLKSFLILVSEEIGCSGCSLE